jgi:5-methylcytosine-specific restriction endonuclease McrA
MPQTDKFQKAHQLRLKAYNMLKQANDLELAATHDPALKLKAKKRTIRKSKEVEDKNCPYCDCKLTVQNATIDHIIPRSKEGDDSCSNTIYCCWICNQIKGDMLPLNFFTFILHEYDLENTSKTYKKKITKKRDILKKIRTWLVQEEGNCPYCGVVLTEISVSSLLPTANQVLYHKRNTINSGGSYIACDECATIKKEYFPLEFFAIKHEYKADFSLRNRIKNRYDLRFEKEEEKKIKMQKQNELMRIEHQRQNKSFIENMKKWRLEENKKERKQIEKEQKQIEKKQIEKQQADIIARNLEKWKTEINKNKE